jgi:hypothetical protein
VLTKLTESFYINRRRKIKKYVFYIGNLLRDAIQVFRADEAGELLGVGSYMKTESILSEHDEKLGRQKREYERLVFNEGKIQLCLLIHTLCMLIANFITIETK